MLKMNTFYKKTLLFSILFLSLIFIGSDKTKVFAEEFDIATFNANSRGKDGTGMPDARLKSIQELVKNENLDFIGLQELDINYTTNRNIGKNIQSLINNSTFPYLIYGQAAEIYGGTFGNGTLTKNRVRGELVRFLANKDGAQQRSYQRMVLEKNGYFVAVYNTHLAYEFDDLRQTQINQLVNLMNNDPIPNKVLLGDFNVKSPSELDVFVQNGYKIAKDNNNNFFNTYPTDSPNRSLDFIITSNNIDILGAEIKGTDKHSDHHLLKAKINVKEQGNENLRFAEDGLLMVTIGKDGYVLRAERYDQKCFRTHVYEYYPNTVYSNLGTQIQYRFDIGYFGNVTSAFRKIQGTTTIDKHYTYYPNAKYGIHGTKIKSSY